MTIQEIEEQIKILKNELQKLKEKENDDWKPKDTWEWEMGLSSIYDSFETEEERNEIDNKFSAWLKLYHIVKYLNKDWIPDWNDECENKYYLYYKYQEEKWGIAATIIFSEGINNSYFKTEKLAERALEMMGDDMDYLK